MRRPFGTLSLPTLLCLAWIVTVLFATVNIGAQQANDRKDAHPHQGSLIGIQYEHWFYGPQSWKTAEAIPLPG